MNTLALDTSSPVLRLALTTDDGFVCRQMDCGLKHNQNLIPAIASMLAESRLKVKDLNLVICASGPGSFTGLRIGLAAAKGLVAANRQADLILVPIIDVYALAWADFPGLVAPLLPAPKNNFYTAVYRKGRAITEINDLDSNGLSRLLSRNEKVMLTGPAALLAAACLRLDNCVCNRLPTENISRLLIAAGEQRLAEKGPDSLSAGPFYVRPAAVIVKKT